MAQIYKTVEANDMQGALEKAFPDFFPPNRRNNSSSPAARGRDFFIETPERRLKFEVREIPTSEESPENFSVRLVNPRPQDIEE